MWVIRALLASPASALSGTWNSITSRPGPGDPTLPGGNESASPRRSADVEVFGRAVEPGRLVHTDKHGFPAVPSGDKKLPPETARFMDANECRSLLPSTGGGNGKPRRRVCDDIDAAAVRFGKPICASDAGQRGESEVMGVA